MSCVPSINAYVAAHTCHSDEQCKHEKQCELKSSANTFTAKPDETSSKYQMNQERRTSWLSTMMGKFSYFGHDGVTIVHDTSPDSMELNRSSSVDLPPVEQIDILSRVRHLSDASTDSSSSAAAPISLLNKDKNMAIPER